MTRRLPITYRTFVHRKSDFDDNRQRFEAQLKRDIVNLLLAHLSDFHSYGTVKVYYDGGQQIVTDALRGGIEYALSIDAIVFVTLLHATTGLNKLRIFYAPLN